MEHNKKNNADTTNKQSANNRTEFAEDCHNNANNTSNNASNNKNKNK